MFNKTLRDRRKDFSQLIYPSVFRDICFFDFKEISCSSDLSVFERLKLISQYSNFSSLGKGNNSKT